MKQINQKHLVGLLKAYPNIKDSEVHVWAAKHGYSTHKVEEGIYKIAQKCVKERRPIIATSKRRTL